MYRDNRPDTTFTDPITPCGKVFRSLDPLIEHLELKWVLCEQDGCNTIIPTNRGKGLTIKHLIDCHTGDAISLASVSSDANKQTLQDALFEMDPLFYNKRSKSGKFWQIENPFAKKKITTEAVVAAISSTVDEAEFAATSASPEGSWARVAKNGKGKSKQVATVVAHTEDDFPVPTTSVLTTSVLTTSVLTTSVPTTSALADTVVELPVLARSDSVELVKPAVSKSKAKKLKKATSELAPAPVTVLAPVSAPAPVLVSVPVLAPATKAIVPKFTAKSTKLRLDTVVEADVESVAEAKPIRHQSQRLLEEDVELENFCPLAFNCSNNGKGKGDETCQLNHTTCLRKLHAGTYTPINHCMNGKICKKPECPFDHPAGRAVWAAKEIARRKQEAEKLALESAQPKVVAKPDPSPDRRFQQLTLLLANEADANVRAQMTKAFFGSA